MAVFNERIVDMRNISDNDVKDIGNILYVLLSDEEQTQIDKELLNLNMNKTVKSPDWVDFSNYCFDNIDVVHTKESKMICKDDDKPELFGRLIDVVEDWLESKGITPADISNNDRPEDDETAAIIYGEDYDKLADDFASILGLTR